MGKALYRKYRPTSFDDAVGQEHITQTLKQAIKSGKISHAYLFTGPRGIGKTSVARILAHEVNDIPYTDDSIHLDIIEIDAASNRRIDEIRDLRDKVHTAPTSAKYKVYIIDEVHMLTREAFNALLKTLEEPPAHCIFILATTEVHKLPETIISRTQRFSFKPADQKTAAVYLGKIAKKEKISITNEALLLLAEHGQGSFRDSMSLLDQLSVTGEEVTEQTVRKMLGLPAEKEIESLINSIEAGDSAQLLEVLEGLKYQGTNAAAIAKELSKQLRTRLIQGASEQWLPNLLRQLLDVSASVNPDDNLEIALLEASAKNHSTTTNHTPKDSTQKPPPTSTPKKEEQPNKPAKIDQEKSIKPKEPQKETAAYTDFDIAKWPEVVEYAKKHAASLCTALRIAKPVLSEGTLTLYFQFPLHQKKLNQAHQKDTIGQIIEEVAKAKVKLECEVNKEMFKVSENVIEEVEIINIPEVTEQVPVATPIKSISNIFGNAEVLESS
jgi:DNA polymerase-3 subunit gamma/tau